MIPSLKRECQLRGRLLFDMGAPLAARGADTLFAMRAVTLQLSRKPGDRSWKSTVFQMADHGGDLDRAYRLNQEHPWATS